MRKLGTAKICITPQSPVRLCGFGFRTKEYETVRKDIYIRVFDLREDDKRVVMIYGDLLWWNSGFVDETKKMLAQRTDILEDEILFTASHNHSGPGTGTNFVPLLETADLEYIDLLKEAVLKGVMEAEENLEEITVKRAETACDLNVYRRVMTEKGIRMMPNYKVEADHRLTVFSFYRKDTSLKGRIVHYPCHANLSKDNELHPDYPGYALEKLDAEDPESISIFWQGFTADMRPNCVLGNQFTAASKEEVESFADNFCNYVLSADKEKDVEESGFEMIRRTVRLPVKQEMTMKEAEMLLSVEREEVRQWAAKVLEKQYRNYEELQISMLRLGTQTCYFFNAEVSMYYAAFARTLQPDAVCVGYADGMIGYLSTAEQIKEGGYEPRDSAVYFAVAGAFDETIEEIIHTAMKEMDRT